MTIQGVHIHRRENRFVFDGPHWAEQDFQGCIHAEKLRWSCDYCDEMAKKLDRNKGSSGPLTITLL